MTCPKYRSGNYKKVPIAIIDEKQVNGSEDILNSLFDSPFVEKELDKRWLSNKANEMMTMQQFKDSANAKKWFRFATDDLGAILYPNICGTLSDSFDAFSYVKNVDSFTGLQKFSIQYLGSLAMYFAASKVKCKLIDLSCILMAKSVTTYLHPAATTAKRNITDEKEALQSALDLFQNEGLEDGTLPFSSGNHNAPDMGDLAVFGVLYAIRDMDAHKYAVHNRGGAVKEWYERMEKIVVK